MYSFKTNAHGNVEVFQNGQRISTGTASSAERYGYSDYLKTQVNPNRSYFSSTANNNPLGITSSSDVTKANAAKTATSAAAGALNGSQPQGEPTPVVPMTELEKERLQLDKDRLAFDQGVTTRAEKALQLSYNAGLTKINNQYKDLKDELDQQYQTDTAYALEAVTQANPYGAITGGDQSLKNYKDKITQKYNAQALKIESKMSEAQMALEAENYEGYAKIVESVEKSKLDFNKDMFNFKLQMNQQLEQRQQFDITTGISKENLAVNKQNVSFDNALAAFGKANYSPDAIDKMIKDSSIYSDPTFKSFYQAYGSNPENIQGILNFMKQGSIAAANLALSQEKAANAQANASIRTNIALENLYIKQASMIPSVGQIVRKSDSVPIKLTDTQSQFLSMGQRLSTTADEIKNLINELPTDAIKGWVTEKGNLVPIVQNELDPKQQQLMNKMYEMNNLFVYFSTGKQINETEFSRLSKQLPSTKGTPTYNKQALDNFKSSIEDRMNNYLDVNGWTIYGQTSDSNTKGSETSDVPSDIQAILDKYK